MIPKFGWLGATVRPPITRPPSLLLSLSLGEFFVQFARIVLEGLAVLLTLDVGQSNSVESWGGLAHTEGGGHFD